LGEKKKKNAATGETAFEEKSKPTCRDPKRRLGKMQGQRPNQKKVEKGSKGKSVETGKKGQHQSEKNSRQGKSHWWGAKRTVVQHHKTQNSDGWGGENPTSNSCKVLKPPQHVFADNRGYRATRKNWQRNGVNRVGGGEQTDRDPARALGGVKNESVSRKGKAEIIGAVRKTAGNEKKRKPAKKAEGRSATEMKNRTVGGKTFGHTTRTGGGLGQSVRRNR